MAAKDPMVVKCTIKAAEYEKIKTLAGRMGMSATRMASMLLQAGLEDNELTIRAVAFVADKMKAAVASISRQERKRVR